MLEREKYAPKKTECFSIESNKVPGQFGWLRYIQADIDITFDNIEVLHVREGKSVLKPISNPQEIQKLVENNSDGQKFVFLQLKSSIDNPLFSGEKPMAIESAKLIYINNKLKIEISRVLRDENVDKSRFED